MQQTILRVIAETTDSPWRRKSSLTRRTGPFLDNPSLWVSYARDPAEKNNEDRRFKSKDDSVIGLRGSFSGCNLELGCKIRAWRRSSPLQSTVALIWTRYATEYPKTNHARHNGWLLTHVHLISQCFFGIVTAMAVKLLMDSRTV